MKAKLIKMLKENLIERKVLRKLLEEVETEPYDPKDSKDQDSIPDPTPIAEEINDVKSGIIPDNIEKE